MRANEAMLVGGALLQERTGSDDVVSPVQCLALLCSDPKPEAAPRFAVRILPVRRILRSHACLRKTRHPYIPARRPVTYKPLNGNAAQLGGGGFGGFSRLNRASLMRSQL